MVAIQTTDKEKKKIETFCLLSIFFLKKTILSLKIALVFKFINKKLLQKVGQFNVYFEETYFP